MIFDKLFRKEKKKKDPYKDFDPFKPKEDPYKKLLREQEQRRKFRVKIAKIAYLLALITSIFNMIISIFNIKAINKAILIYSFPISYLFSILVLYYGTNKVGDSRSIYFGIKVLFLPIILNSLVFYFITQIRFSEKFILTISYYLSAISLLILTGIVKDRFQFKYSTFLTILLLFLSFAFATASFLIPVLGG